MKRTNSNTTASKCSVGLRRWLWGVLGLLACSGAAVHYLLPKVIDVAPTVHRNEVRLFSDVLSLTAAQLAEQEMAQVNLICAEGLPGAHGLDIEAVRSTLDRWADRVKSETERQLCQFREHPRDFKSSESYFRALALVTVLQQDCGVRYNPERVRAPDFADSRDLFLHGSVLGHGGTCVSMPVVYVAVGRRLGYPLKLVTAKGHLFARWEGPDGKERLNLEATNQGLNCFPDEYYHNWPVPMTPEEIASGQYLKSLTPAEELAVFLSARGHCLEAAGRLPEAQVAHAHAHVLAPKSPVYLAFLAAAVKKELPDWQRVAVDLGQMGTQQRRQPTN
jgi:regulator of sirC expression with transglutaminase-like and TPR domain